MAVTGITQIWKLHSIEIVDIGGSFFIGEFTAFSFPVQGTTVRDVSSGDIFAKTGRLDFTSFDLNFTSAMAAEVFKKIPIGGLCIKPAEDLVHVYAALHDCDGPVAGALHRRFTLTDGIIHLASAQCNHKEDLEVSCVMRGMSSDGVAAPVAISDVQSLPTSVQLAKGQDRYSLHNSDKTLVNNVGVQDKQSINIDFGTTVTTRGADSQRYDSFASIDSVLPTMTIQGTNITWLDDLLLGVDGGLVAHSGANIAQIPFRRRKNASEFEADIEFKHILMTVNGIAWFDDLASGGRTDAATNSLRIDALDDGTTAPINIQVDAAVP